MWGEYGTARRAIWEHELFKGEDWTVEKENKIVKDRGKHEGERRSTTEKRVTEHSPHGRQKIKGNQKAAYRGEGREPRAWKKTSRKAAFGSVGKDSCSWRRLGQKTKAACGDLEQNLAAGTRRRKRIAVLGSWG
ncbi:hypothetical protein COP1_006836 [Malus domestica]